MRTPEESTAIDQLRVGDYVLSRNEHSRGGGNSINNVRRVEQDHTYFVGRIGSSVSSKVMPIIKPAISSAKYIADFVVKKASQVMGFLARKAGNTISMACNVLKSVANGTKGLLDLAVNTGKNLRQLVKRMYWGKAVPDTLRSLYEYKVLQTLKSLGFKVDPAELKRFAELAGKIPKT